MIDRAEDPDKMIKQVILDMENQYLKVKTQVAVSIADQHMLEKKFKENDDVGNDWMRKAERAVDKSQDDLARVHHTESVATAEVELLTDDVGDRLTRMGRDTELDRLLADLKARRSLPA